MSEALSPHFTEIKVRGYHLDGYGHVHHPRYLEFLEEAAWRCIEKYGSIEFLVNNRLGFVIVNININYRRAAAIGEELVIETAMRDIGTKSAIMRRVVKLKGTTSVIVEADVTFVIVGGGAGGAIGLEGDLLAMFQRMPRWGP
ncbi:MAG: thioesterase [Candidatus Rokuibacteriota bacterium]|nr:MAG: thioesterase [Candidatus Rokubacteria bacterium]PYM63164.1 MAG: thioesterase [Candidatus Rokubacteria bacterium]PYN67165.1 MAG: thioesterase [Candidatus Rokubacteria bacterium]